MSHGLFKTTLRENTLASYVILGARQRISCVCCSCSSGEEWETILLMRCLATKMTSHARVFSWNVRKK